MNWTHTDMAFEEEIQSPQYTPRQASDTIQENREKSLLQLTKFEDTNQNQERQAYISLIAQFNTLIAEDKIDAISQTLMTKDCACFLFTPTGTSPSYSLNPKDLKVIYKGRKIKDQRVRETNVDLQQQTVAQLSTCEVHHEDEQKSTIQAAFEIFSIENSKINKYRAWFGDIPSLYASEDPLMQTQKDKKLAKVKEINYALAGEPDFDKMLMLVHDDFEYRIWSWDNGKAFRFDKHNLKSEFKSLEEDYKLKFIVPYEIYTEDELVIGTYAYHLEGKTVFPGTKSIWLTKCIYGFNTDLEIISISQQGELYREEDATIPFEVYSRERLAQRMQDFIQNLKPGLDLLFNDVIHPTCRVCRIGPAGHGKTGLFEGLDEITEVFLNITVDKLDWLKIVDLYVDSNACGYDNVIIVACAEELVKSEKDSKQDKIVDIVSFSRLSFENGKVSKTLQCFSYLTQPIPSLFDDNRFSAANIRPIYDLEMMNQY